MAFTTNKLTGWKIAGTMFSDEITNATKPVLYMALIVFSGALVLGGVLIFFIVRAISKPLNQARSICKEHQQRRFDTANRSAFK